MKILRLLPMVFLMAPINVFAHAGHVEWRLGLQTGSTELLEVSLVVGAIAFYLLSKMHKTPRMKTSKIKRHKN